MNRLLTVLVVGLVLVAADAPAVPVAPPPREVVHYFPTTVGAKWTYQYPSGQVTLVVTRVERKLDAHIVSVGRVSALRGLHEPHEGGVVTPHEKVEVSRKGLYRLESVAYFGTLHSERRMTWSEKLVPDVPVACLLRLPAKSGDRWEMWPGSDRQMLRVAGREEAITVPAGVFTAVAVDTIAAGSPVGQDLKARFWYAPGVGAVKWTTLDGGEVVLKSFAPGKDRAR